MNRTIENRIRGLGRYQSLLELAFLGTGILVSTIFYVPLYKDLWNRSEVLEYFIHFVLPLALFHLVGFLVLTLLFRVRNLGCFAYWTVSSVTLLLLGGSQRFVAWVLLGILAFLLVEIGRWCAEQVFPEDACGWGVSLGIGILLSSYAGAVLALLQLFRWWILAALLVSSVYALSGRLKCRIRNLVLSVKELSTGWNWSHALGYEGFFLLSAFLFVSATAPEMNSDALRFYWPYIKMMKADGGFFSIPYQWSYSIPQAGLTYAAAIYALWGGVAVRWAMPLVWITLIVVLVQFQKARGKTSNLAVSMVLGSSPLILWVSCSLMQDSYVCLCVVIMGLLCLVGSSPGSSRYWFVLGSFLGMAWTAKYSTLAFMLPLGTFALMRCWKARSLRFERLLLAPLGAVLAATPWLIHTYRQTGNPLFPFLQKIWPSSIWPNGAGFGNLDSFRLPQGFVSWLLWPVWMTYQTNRFVEMCNGSLGLVLPVIFLLSLLAIFQGTFFARSMILSGLIGTVLLCSQTGYIRYWLPGLWLAAFGASEILERITRSNAAKICSICAAMTIALAQLPFAMFCNWASPRGWPWDSYIRKLNESQYIERQYQGYYQLASCKELTRDMPKVWFTGYEAAGHLKVRPLEALLWEMRIHGADHPRMQLQYLGSTGCKFWIVNRKGEDAKWLWRTGVAQFYWEDDYLVLSVGSLNLFRMRPVEDVLRAFDARARPGTDLVWDGQAEAVEAGKPRYWWFWKTANWGEDSAIAKSGKGYLLVRDNGECRQDIPLPKGLKRLELVEWIRSGSTGQIGKANVQLVLMGQSEEDLKVSARSVNVTEEWKEFCMTSDVPPSAVWASIFLKTGDDKGVCLFDNIGLRVIE